MKHAPRLLLFCLWTFLLLFATGQLVRIYTLAHDNYISLIIFTVIVLLHINLAKSITAKAILYNYLGSFATVYVIVTTIEGWRSSMLGMPNMLFVVLGMISGYIVYNCVKQKSYRKLFLPIAFLGLALLQAFVIEPYWIHFARFGTFTGKINESLSKSHNVEQLFKDKDKIYVLDFWSTSCGVCFKKFPKLQGLYDQYKTSDKVAVAAVNIRLPRDTSGMAQELIVNRGYSFPVFVADETLKKNFGVEFYPTVIMVKGNSIVFRGDIEAAESFLENYSSHQ